MPAKTIEEFIRDARIVHGDRYDYSQVVYTISGKKVIITCKKHGQFLQTPDDHLSGSGCRECGIEVRCIKMRIARAKAFLPSARSVHGDLYNYSLVIYEHSCKQITIICKKHGPFQQTPNNHLHGSGCRKCWLDEKKEDKAFTFIPDARSIHEDLYDYSKVVYTKMAEDVTIICKKHGPFPQIPASHLRGSGCPYCNTSKGSSNISIQWIEEYAYSHRLKGIVHAGNGGEYRIPGTRFKVDGFHARSLTAFEFHGSPWHGDPNVYAPTDRPHPIS